MKLLMVAAEPREFSGVLKRARETRAVGLGAHWARSAKLGGNDVLLVTNGAGRRRAAAAVEAAVSVGFEPQTIASVGYCGALAPELGVADVVVADQAAGGAETYRTAPVSGGGRFLRGGLITVDHVARTAEEKRVLGANGAKVVDMEAAGVAERARGMGRPVRGNQGGNRPGGGDNGKRLSTSPAPGRALRYNRNPRVRFTKAPDADTRTGPPGVAVRARLTCLGSIFCRLPILSR